MKTITIKLLHNLGACSEGIDWFQNQKETRADKVINALMKANKFDWANWLIVRLMSHKNQVRYAVYAAELVLPIFKKKYPKDKRPRKAIQTTKRWLKSPTEENRIAAYAIAASYAANVAYAAYCAVYAVTAAADVFVTSADAASYAAADAAKNKKETREKIIKYGLKLIKQ
jgi:branched-subunit amino acid aminotransferase/4-amino-4-deoxychorismate lyase